MSNYKTGAAIWRSTGEKRYIVATPDEKKWKAFAREENRAKFIADGLPWDVALPTQGGSNLGGGSLSGNDIYTYPVWDQPERKFKVGDRVRAVNRGPVRAGWEGTVTEVRDPERMFGLWVEFDTPKERGVAMDENEVEHVNEEIDFTHYPSYGGWGEAIHIGRNAGTNTYGHASEHEYGIFLKANISKGISIIQARELAKYLNDLSDRIEHDQAVTKRNHERAAERLITRKKGEKKQEILKKIAELQAEAEGLED